MFVSKLKQFSKVAAPMCRLQAMKNQSAFMMARQSNMFAMTAVRGFASFDQIEKASQKLTKSLESEIKYENENYSQLEDIETFLNESGFLFKETDGGLKMTLTKEVGDKTVEVVFEAR